MPTAKKQPGGPTQFRFIGDHAQVLENGQPVGPGEYVSLATEDMVGINKMLLDDGKLIDASDYTPDEPVTVEPTSATETTTTTEETPA